MPVSARTPSAVRSACFKRLHELEVEGESAATPAIALAEVVLFLLPIIAFVSTVTFVAYYLSG